MDDDATQINSLTQLSDLSRVNTLANVLSQLDDALDLDYLLGRIIKISMEATGADRASILVIDDDGSVSNRILARPGQTPEFAALNVRKVMSEGLAGWVFRNRKPILITDVSEDPRWITLPEDDWETGSVMVAPVIHGERVRGVITLQHEQKGYFDEGTLVSLILVADHTGRTLEKAFRYWREMAEKQALLALLDQVAEPLVVVDAAGMVVLCNQAMGRRLPDLRVGLVLTQASDAQSLWAAIQSHLNQTSTNGGKASARKARIDLPGSQQVAVLIGEVPPLGVFLKVTED